MPTLGLERGPSKAAMELVVRGCKSSLSRTTISVVTAAIPAFTLAEN
jgi:hypothetical protein